MFKYVIYGDVDHINVDHINQWYQYHTACMLTAH